MDIDAIITVEDYEKPRTTAQFAEWWETRYRAYGSTREGVIYCREGRGLSKKFHEEAHPMRRFMVSYVNDPAIRCRLSAGDDTADAILIDSAGAMLRQIQVTFAVEGRTDNLRLRELTKSGHVDGLGKPVETGRGKNRTVSFPVGAMTLHQTHVEEFLSLVKARIENKSSKGYDPKFILVVGFNDSTLDAEDIGQFARLKGSTPHRFSEVYLVGIHGIILVPLQGRLSVA